MSKRYRFTGQFTVDIEAENVAQAYALLRRERFGIKCIGSCVGSTQLKNNRDAILHTIKVSKPVFYTVANE